MFNSFLPDFPRELDEEEDDDENVENVEETFGKFATIPPDSHRSFCGIRRLVLHRYPDKVNYLLACL